MTFTLNATNKQVLVQFTDAEWDILMKARTQHGAGIIKDLMKNWLRHMWKQQEAARLSAHETPMPSELA